MSTKVNVYLSYKGTCEEAFAFYEEAFRTKIAYMGRFGDQPEMAAQLSDADKKKIMHVYLPISSETALMGSDVIDGFCGAPNLVEGNNVALSISTETEDEAKRIFGELSAGGQVTMPLEKTFWNALYGMFVDKFGIHWMVNYNYDKQ